MADLEAGGDFAENIYIVAASESSGGVVPTANSSSKSSRKGQQGDKRQRQRRRKGLRQSTKRIEGKAYDGGCLYPSREFVYGNAWHVGMEEGGREGVPCVVLSLFTRHFLAGGWCVFP